MSKETAGIVFLCSEALWTERGTRRLFTHCGLVGKLCEILR